MMDRPIHRFQTVRDCLPILCAAFAILVSAAFLSASHRATWLTHAQALIEGLPGSTPNWLLYYIPESELWPRSGQPASPPSMPTPGPTSTTMAVVTAGQPQTVTVPILMYHHIGPLPADADVYTQDLTVDPAVFEGHLQAMTGAGYHPISLYDVYHAVKTGTPLPDKPVVLTFDDGYRDAYEFAFPLLKKYGYTATFFLVTDPIDQANPGYLTWPQAEEMSAAGMDLEPHTKTHQDLRDRGWDFLIWEIVGSAQTVSAHSGHASRFFAYPSGRYDEQVLTILQQAGFWGAVTTHQGTIHGPDQLDELSRIRIRRSDSPTTVLEKLSLIF